MRHPQRSQQEWRQLFKQQQQSGLSAVEFCRQQHINIQTFYARRSDIRLQHSQSKFVQVKREVIPFHLNIWSVMPSLSNTYS